MKPMTTIGFFCALLLPFLALAASPQDNARKYRAEAKAAWEQNKPEQAHNWLGRAVSETAHITDAYTRENNLRYIAQEYARYGENEKARQLYAKAMAAALQASPWYRQQSAVIGVLELQATMKDVLPLRHNFVAAIEHGLLKQADDAKKAGEVGRLFKAMDAALTIDDVAPLLKHILTFKTDELRVKTLFALHRLKWNTEIMPHEWHATVELSAIKEPHAKASPFEQVMWRCLLARLYAMRADDEAARQQLIVVDGLVRRMNEKRDKAKEIYEQTQRALAPQEDSVTEQKGQLP